MSTYNGGVEFCDLSAFDKEKVNQGILLSDEEYAEQYGTDEESEKVEQ